MFPNETKKKVKGIAAAEKGKSGPIEAIRTGIWLRYA